MDQILNRFLEAVSKSKGFQVGLPQSEFYYEIPSDYQDAFSGLNKKLRSNRFTLQDQEISNETLSVFAVGQPMTPDNGPQLLLTDLDSKIYYCYSLDYEILPIKLLYNSIYEMLPNIDYIIHQLSSRYVTVDLTPKKIKDIIDVKTLEPFDCVDLSQDSGSLYIKITLGAFKKHKIDISDFHAYTNSDGLLEMKVDSLNEKIAFEKNGDYHTYLEFLDKILKIKKKSLKAAIIELPTWDKTIGIGEEVLGLGLFTETEYKDLTINRFAIC